jgi:hypothetical protein
MILEKKGKSLVIIALIMASGVMGVVIVDTIIAMQQAEAKSICGQTQGGLRNGSNRHACPPNN